MLPLLPWAEPLAIKFYLRNVFVTYSSLTLSFLERMSPTAEPSHIWGLSNFSLNEEEGRVLK